MPAAEPAPTGVRARARIEVRAAILAAAAKRVAGDGAADLSLRAVARDVGMVSSAVYRYFDSRDALLTALIIEAYDSLGDFVEEQVESTRGRPAAERWVDAALAVRRWALEHPNDYALIYGTPIPGYAAPDDTVASGTRASRALIGIVRETDRLDPIVSHHIEPVLAESFVALRKELGLDVDDATTLAVITAWSQLFGLLTFELFGQTRNFVSDDEALFRAAATSMAASIGLPMT
ncbi:MAG TPA: TetR/AcrR family transcriptional regulator [Ilumatobacteraceae bacterium]|nr:TetR/AcrR family transcriptional regulator [Ilumatobacteraceae bacterium]